MPISSPFPGMDPWLESHWGDIHHSMVQYARDQMQPKLPPDLRARLQERVFIDTPEGLRRVKFPDVRIEERPDRHGASPSVGLLETAEPIVVPVQDDPVTEGYLEIIEAGSGKNVVTVIEVLSRSNKVAGEGRKLYRQKQRECPEAGVNLVEIDLLRSGRRQLIARTESVPKEYRTPYQVCAWRGAKPSVAEVYAVPLRQRLPRIRVPLRSSDRDVELDIQLLLEQAYLNGGYDDTDYTIEPDPPLNPSDAAWADQLLRERGLR